MVWCCRKKVDEDLRDVERCLEEAVRIDNVRIEVDTIKTKLQRYVCMYVWHLKLKLNT